MYKVKGSHCRSLFKLSRMHIRYSVAMTIPFLSCKLHIKCKISCTCNAIADLFVLGSYSHSLLWQWLWAFHHKRLQVQELCLRLDGVCMSSNHDLLIPFLLRCHHLRRSISNILRQGLTTCFVSYKIGATHIRITWKYTVDGTRLQRNLAVTRFEVVRSLRGKSTNETGR